MIKRIAYAIPVLAIAIVGILGVSFWLVPKDRLNTLISHQLTDAFGYNVVVAGKPSVSLFPYLSVSFGPLRVVPSGQDEDALVDIERASGRLSVTSLWEGKPALRSITLERARLSLTRDEKGFSNWTAARFFKAGGQDASGEPELRFPKRLRFVSLKDSTLVIKDPGLERPIEVGKINTTIVGPPRSRDFVIDGSFEWRGEIVEAKVNLAKPGVFMTGGVSPAFVDVSAAPINATFEGDLSWIEELRGQGSLEADIASPDALTRWMELGGGEGLPSEKISLSGEGTFTRRIFDFRPFNLELKDGKADGSMVLDLSGAGIGITGTLAFDRLIMMNRDLNGETPQQSLFETVVATGRSGATLDLRLSAETAQFSGQEMRNLAIGVLLKDPSFLVNIGSAELLQDRNDQEQPGKLRGEIKVEFGDEIQTAGANLTVSEVSMDMLESVFGVKLPFDGKINASVRSLASGPDTKTMEETLKTAIVVDIKDGTMDAIVLHALLDDEADIVPAKLNGDALSTEFARAKITAIVQPNGIVDVSELQLSGEGLAVSASGKVDITGDRLSMLGTVSRPISKDQKDKSSKPRIISFTLGGAVSKPRISSVNDVAVPTEDKTQ